MRRHSKSPGHCKFTMRFKGCFSSTFRNSLRKLRIAFQQFPKVTSIGSPPSENPADSHRAPRRPCRTLEETPAEPPENPLRGNFLGEPRRGLCPSDGDPPELKKPFEAKNNLKRCLGLSIHYYMLPAANVMRLVKRAQYMGKMGSILSIFPCFACWHLGTSPSFTSIWGNQNGV